MKFSPITLLALPAVAVLCFLAGRWTYTPTLDTTVPSIPSTPSTAADLPASATKTTSPPYHSEALANLDPESRMRAVKGIVETLRDTDISAAWKVLSESGIPMETGYNSMHRDLLRKWVTEDPPAAIVALSTIRESNVQAELFGGLVDGWGKKNFNEALEYMRQIDDPNLAAKGLMALADVNMPLPLKTDPQQIFDAILEKIPPGKNLQSTLDSLSYKWVKKDPLAAMQWYKTTRSEASKSSAPSPRKMTTT